MTKEERIDWLCRLRADLNNGVIFTPWNKEFTEALNDVLEEKPYKSEDYRRGWHDAIGKALDEAYDIGVDGERFTVVQEETLLGLGMASLIPSGEWIPVSERLPNIGQDVLVTNTYRSVLVWTLYKDYQKTSIYTGENGLYWEDERGDFIDFDDAIAWMPLPEPMKVGEENC